MEKDNKNKKPKLVGDEDIYNFVLNAFKEGAVPLNKDEFEKCIDNNTTDGSFCFSNKFGPGENDVVMLFFYPYECAVPPRYRHNLRDDQDFAFNFLMIDYQTMLAEKMGNEAYLANLLNIVEYRRNMMAEEVEFQLAIKSIRNGFDGKNGVTQKYDGESRKSIEKLSKSYEHLVEMIKRKIKSLQSPIEVDEYEIEDE